MDKAFKNLSNQESTGAVKETGRGMGDTFNPFKDRVDASDTFERRDFFSMKTDPRNKLKQLQLQATTFDQSDYIVM